MKRSLIASSRNVPKLHAAAILTAAERNYALIEREALAIAFGIQKFHKYLYGRMFTILTDIQPLTDIFDTKKHANSVAASNLHRCLNFLASCQHKIVYRKGGLIGNADELSWLPLPRRSTNETVNYFCTIPDMPITAKEVAKETDKNDKLRRIREMTWHGGPKALDKALGSYFIRRMIFPWKSTVFFGTAA